MAKSVAAMVPKIDDLINVLSNNKNITYLQGKLSKEIEDLADEDMYDAIICWPRNMICLMYSLLYLVTSINDITFKCFIVECSLISI